LDDNAFRRADGQAIVLTVARDPKLIYYAKQDLMVVPLDSTSPRIVTAHIDRNLFAPSRSADGKFIYALMRTIAISTWFASMLPTAT
jgi:hypothetical protein